MRETAEWKCNKADCIEAIINGHQNPNEDAMSYIKKK